MDVDKAVVPTRLSTYIRERILSLRRTGKTIIEIKNDIFVTERVKISRQAVSAFLRRFARTGTIVDVNVNNRRQLLTAEHLQFIDRKIEEDPEISGRELAHFVNEQFRLNVSPSTVKRARLQLGWKRTQTQYCQLVRVVNKPKRLNFAIECVQNREAFDDVIFTDETTVKIQTSTRQRYRKEGEKVQKIAKPKHPYSVHVWAGISRRGATKAYIFTGIMDSIGYQGILNDTLLPFLRTTYPDRHRFMQDNDPKHVSRSTKQWMENNGENLWAVLKHHIRRKIKPRTQQELINGIKQFWEALTPNDCNKYIDHLFKVVPAVIEEEGAASGF